MKIHTYAKQGDIPGLITELERGIDMDSVDEQCYRRTPLMHAASSPQAGLDMVQFLVEQGANLNTIEAEFQDTVLGLAVKAGNMDKIQYLLDAGADIYYQTPDGYDVLIHAMHCLDVANNENLIAVVKLLIDRGANLRGMSSYGESALTVASNNGRFDVIELLLAAGADAQPLGWTDLMEKIVFGTFEDVHRLINAGANLFARDYWDRTPWLLSLQVGDLEKAKLLLSAGAHRNDRGRCGKTPLMYAIANNYTDILTWLIEEGFDLEATDEFGLTPLMMAAEYGATECVRILLNAGANPLITHGYNSKAINQAKNLEIVQILIEAGEDINDINDQMRCLLTGVGHQDEFQVSQEDYLEGKRRQFGKSNPEVMTIPFWEDMVRTGLPAYGARATFNDTENWSDEPVWCFSRFGKSLTQLPDGRLVEIAGEHEDYYDPDFCIYNDVILHEGNGKFKILGYPKEIFPPTDFHSATLVGNYIYIIGNLGYKEERLLGETPVYQLDCETFEIVNIPTTGDKPGWISRHKAYYHKPYKIIVKGGQISIIVNGEEDYVNNNENYVLDLSTLTWTR